MGCADESQLPEATNISEAPLRYMSRLQLNGVRG